MQSLVGKWMSRKSPEVVYSVTDVELMRKTSCGSIGSRRMELVEDQVDKMTSPSQKAEESAPDCVLYPPQKVPVCAVEMSLPPMDRIFGLCYAFRHQGSFW